MALFLSEMRLICLITVVSQCYSKHWWQSYKPIPAWIEEYHKPPRTYPERKANGTDLHHDTPDFRIEEESWGPKIPHFYAEEQRPYRISPFWKQQKKWNHIRAWFTSFNKEHPENLGCYCCTVFKRLTVLAGCAIITTRHLLTTATSTELVLKDYGHGTNPHVNQILGAWYDHNGDTFNSSVYMTPARIHYHPKYIHPNLVNTSHPLPFTYDLAVWASTYRFMGTPYFAMRTRVAICARGSSHRWQFLASTPRPGDLAHIVGYQYMKAYRRRILPWFKYVVRTRMSLYPCPKTDWGWMICISGNWAKYGIDSGAAWHRALEGNYWLYDGLIGMHAFTMQLRSEALTHYFTVIDTHPVLDFLYDAYMGRLPYRFLDYRYYDTQWRAPYKKPWAWVEDETYYQNIEYYFDTDLPYSRK